MSRRILVAGSGKMARDIGFYCVRRGHRVTWVSCSRERLAALEEWFAKTARRTARIDPDFTPQEVCFAQASDPRIDKVDLLIECTVEEVSKKQALLRTLEHVLSDDTLLVSNSSSILPREIHPGCMGFHCFYPLELTRLAEIVLPEDCPEERRAQLLTFATQSQLECIEQTDANAFMANRLLLPIHTECFRLLMSGEDPARIDAATVSPLASVGQLSLMDAIGLDLLHVSADRYLSRMPEDEAREYLPLIEGLGQLRAMGKFGSRHGDGLLSGAPIPWTKRPSEDDSAALARRFLYLLVNTCYHALGRNAMTTRGLSLALGALVGSETTVSQVVEAEGREVVRRVLEGLHRDTGLTYFRPAEGIGGPF